MWQETKDGLYKMFVFKDFKQAFGFMTSVANLAEERNHHPKWQNQWNKVEIWLSTHEEGGGVTKKDTDMARAIDELSDGDVLDDSNKEVESSKIVDKRLKLFADGGSRGNPGPSASGYALLDQNDRVILKDGAFMGVTTNNQAEYNALKIGLEKALDMGVKEIDVFMDSLLVINQMKGVFKVRHQDILPVYNAVRGLVRQFQDITFTHVPRALNKLADSEVNRVLDLEAQK